MKIARLLALALIIVSLFAFASCDITETLAGILPGADQPEQEGELDFGDWENWGQSDWVTGKFEEYDPSKNYNKIDWSKDYPGLASKDVYDLSNRMQFVSTDHVQVYQAENAALTGKANANEAGYYVGYLDSASVTFTITATEECDVLLVANFSGTPGSKYGYSFNEVFQFRHNDQTIDTSDAWIYPGESWTEFKENVVGELHLTEGVNTIYFYSSVGRCNFDYIKLVPKGELSEEPLTAVYSYDYEPGLIVQAEATNFGNAVIETTAAGRVVVAQIADGCSLKFNVNCDGEQTMDLIIEALIRVEGEYSANAADRFTILINGEELDISGVTLKGVVDKPNGSSTRWWNLSYTVNNFGEITLKDGANSIEIIPGKEMNLDFIKFDIKHETTDIILEAEEAVAENIATEGGATGTIVGTRLGSKLTFTLNSDTAREADFYINAVAAVYEGYPANANGRLLVKVNGVEVDISGATFSGMDNPNQWWKSTYNNILLGTINLVEGENIIEISTVTTGEYGEMNIDYFFIR